VSVFELAVRLTRYLVAYGLLNILGAIFTGLLQAQKQFFLPVAVSLIGNVAIRFQPFFVAYDILALTAGRSGSP